MSLNFDNVFGIHERAMLLRSERAGLLATNLANADTPNYKARDIDFKAELSRAQDSLSANKLNVTHENHIRGIQHNDIFTEVLYRTPSQPSIDGNTVDTQIEQTAFVKNSMQYQASLRFMTGKVKGIMSAIRGD